MSGGKCVQNIKTLRTSAAIIKFSGAAEDDFSGSESENSECEQFSELNSNKLASGVPETHQNGIEDVPATNTNDKVFKKSAIKQSQLKSNENEELQKEESRQSDSSGRFNPFDRELIDVDDHFKDVAVSKQDENGGDCSDNSFSSFESDEPVVPETSTSPPSLGLAEDHFSRPEGMFEASTKEELATAIEDCKMKILECVEKSDERRNLVHKLIQLRIKLADAKEEPLEVEEDVKIVVGHRFRKRITKTSEHYCENCASVIWGVLQSWYKCSDCGFCCHDKCLNLIYRTCAGIKVQENPNYIFSIRPEKGLGSQNYKCAECSIPISYLPGQEEPRQCDYTGAFYCRKCHWNDTMVIPARVLHNWDLDHRKVCRASKQFLRIMSSRACIRVQDVNPMLFNFVEELNDVKRMREEILIMKRYFLSCQDALNSKLLLQLQQRQHFVENSDIFSLRDLMDVAEDVLLPQLAKIHSSFAQHIKTDCQRCQAKGYMCELCDMKEVLFPFDNIAIVCDTCMTVLHRHCFFRRNRICPKCERISRRAAEVQKLEQSVED